MKALSLLQPWATLAVRGVKTLETRGWTTAYRGPLLIHAGKSRAGRLIAERPAIRRYVPDFDALPFGALIGEVQLVDVVRWLPDDDPAGLLAGQTLEEGAFGEARTGRWAFVLEDAVAFETPIPARGMLGLFDV